MPRDSPPLSRGARGDFLLGPGHIGLTPALAGSTPCLRRRAPEAWTHPRSRGEHAATSCSGPGTSDSPPLSRGAHLACGGARLRLGLTPALAGSTGPGSISPRPFWNHPRSRGEHKLAGRPLPNYRDSPSLSRGARFLCGRPGPCPGLTPALAGSTRPRCRPMPRSGTHPRSRGEHLGVVIAVARAADSLPLSRGAR